MFRQCTLITFAADANVAAQGALIDRLRSIVNADSSVVHHRFTPGLMPGTNGGDVVWHVHFREQPDWAASAIRTLPARLAGDPAIDHIDSCAYRPTGTHVRAPAIGESLYRALFVAVRPGTAPDRSARFAREVAAMPDYIPEIRNWALSPVEEAVGARRWTHVWEQEFDSLADLRGPYMTNPYHWGFVDRWFDPEHHDCIVDILLCHSASALKDSVIALYDDPVASV